MVSANRFWSAKSMAFGIDMSGWKHNQTFRMRNCPDIEFFVQDEYKLMAKDKWSKVREIIQASIDSDSPNVWFLNYCSAQNWPIQPPRYIAWSTNKALREHLDSIGPQLDTRKCLGVIVLDFASKNLIQDIFKLNFREL